MSFILLMICMLTPIAHAGMYDDMPPETRRLKAAIALESGKFDEVRQYLIGLDDRDSYMMRAHAAYAIGEFKLAAFDFKNYLQMSDPKTEDPKDKAIYVFALKHLVNSYYMLEDFSSALHEGKKLVHISPTHENIALVEAIRKMPINTSVDAIKGDDVEIALLSYFEPHGYGDTLITLKEERYRDILIDLRGNEKPEARLLKGFAYYGLEEYSRAAIEMEAGREVFLFYDSRPLIDANNKIHSNEVIDSQGKLFKIIVLRQLMMAYYKSDDLERSMTVAMELAKFESNDYLSKFILKLKRELRASKDQVTESSAHFKIIYNGYAHSTVNRLILSVLEDAYRDIGQKLDYYPTTAITVVLHTGQTFRDVTRSPRWTGGVFMDGRIRIPVVGVEDFDPESVRRILYHEYTHALIHSLSSKCSRWMHEGLAEYFSRSSLDPVSAPSVSPGNLDRHLTSSHVRYVAIGYVESRNTVKVLMDNHGLYAIKQYLSSMKEGKSSADAFKGAFFLSYNEFMDKYGRKR